MPLYNLSKQSQGEELLLVFLWWKQGKNNDEQLEFKDNAIVDMINFVEQDDREEEDLTNDSVPCMSHSEGLVVLEVPMRYLEQQPQATPVDNVILRRWCDIATCKRNNVFKKKTIDNYFKMQ